MSELEQIREALDLTLDQMADAMGVAHSTIHRWESAPNTRSGKKALEEYKALYKKRLKKEWVSPPPKEGIADVLQRMKREDPARFHALLKSTGPSVAELSPSYVTGMLPEHIEQAWLILHRTAQAGGVDLMAEEDQKEVGEAIATVAEGVKQGPNPEGEQRLVRLAEKLLRALGRAPR